MICNLDEASSDVADAIARADQIISNIPLSGSTAEVRVALAKLILDRAQFLQDQVIQEYQQE